MFDLVLAHKEYKDKGYVVLRKLFSEDYCDSLHKKSNNLTPKVKIPFSDVAWGFGQLFDIEPFCKIVNNKILKDFLTIILGQNYKLNHMMLNNKAAFIGPDEIWHQEVFNIDTFAPGSKISDWNKFTQIFIAVDEHSLENGCLRVLPKSHKLGVLESEDVVWNNHGHKRRVTYKEMERAVSACGMENVILDKGDVVFFNHLLVHGSASNPSKYSRKAIVMQAQQSNVSLKNNNIFQRETKYRKDFVINEYTKKINELKSKNIYKDFNSRKK